MDPTTTVLAVLAVWLAIGVLCMFFYARNEELLDHEDVAILAVCGPIILAIAAWLSLVDYIAHLWPRVKGRWWRDRR